MKSASFEALFFCSGLVVVDSNENFGEVPLGVRKLGVLLFVHARPMPLRFG